MPRPTTSLRTVFATIALAVAAAALVVSVALVVLSARLGQVVQTLSASVESVRLAEESQLALLVHARAGDAFVRADAEGDLRRRLAEARRFIGTAPEAALFDSVVAEVNAYLAAAHGPAEPDRLAQQEGAFRALERLARMNVERADEARAWAARWDRRASTLGLTVAGLVLGFSAWLLWWLRARAFRPVLALAEAMDRFGQGDREARADQDAALEWRRIGERFNAMAAALVAERQAQMAFVGGIAHDLRNPRSVIKVSLSMLRPDGPQPDAARVREVLVLVERQVARMERMLADFLDSARIEAGLLELSLDLHDARKIVRDVVTSFATAAPDHHVGLTVPDQVVPLRCDALRVEQVVTNLLSNAVKYSPPGSRVDVAVQDGAQEAVIQVRDQGVGIDPADRERIFEPFRRGLSNDAVPGAGLGLAVVRRIVDAHGGTVAVDSTPGHGSTFIVRLPYSARPDGPGEDR